MVDLLARTPSQTTGPFFSIGLCARPGSELVAPDSDGALEIAGRVLDGAGDGVPDFLVEIWQADADGRYRGEFGWGRCGATPDGGYRFVTVKPGSVPVADGRPQAPHLNVLVFARGLLKPVYTRMYFPDEELNDTDPVLSALAESDRPSLIAVDVGGRLQFDIRLQGERETPFFTA
jgi:protocatechuate 3,4-dioxygenase, alpha subunit